MLSEKVSLPAPSASQANGVDPSHLSQLLNTSSSTSARDLLKESLTIPGAIAIDRFGGDVVRVPNPASPLLGTYLMTPELAAEYIAGVHSTSGEYASSICQNGLIKAGPSTQAYLAPLDAGRSVQTRIIGYARDAVARTFYDAVSHMYAQGLHQTTASDQELLAHLRNAICETATGGKIVFGAIPRIPGDLAHEPELMGQNIEFLVPVRELTNNSNGSVSEGVFAGYEASAEFFSPEHIVYRSPLFSPFQERDLFSGRFADIFRAHKTHFSFAIAERFRPRGEGENYLNQSFN